MGGIICAARHVVPECFELISHFSELKSLIVVLIYFCQANVRRVECCSKLYTLNDCL